MVLFSIKRIQDIVYLSIHDLKYDLAINSTLYTFKLCSVIYFIIKLCRAQQVRIPKKKVANE